MRGLTLIVGALFGLLLGAALTATILTHMSRREIEGWRSNVSSLQEDLEKSESARKAAEALMARNAKEIEYLRQDSMDLAKLREQVKTNAPSLASEPGFFIDTNRIIYLNYATSDPVLQSFLRSVMTSDGDTASKGRAIFTKLCAACHQPNGEGKEGLAPPLAGSEWIKAPSGDRLVRIVLNGVTGPIHVQGQTWNLTMPPWRENLDDEQIATVLNFIRSKWGGEGAAQIKDDLSEAARAEPHPKPETEEELLKIPLK